MGHKLAAGAGGGAEMTLVDRSEIGYQMRIVRLTFAVIASSSRRHGSVIDDISILLKRNSLCTCLAAVKLMTRLGKLLVSHHGVPSPSLSTIASKSRERRGRPRRTDEYWDIGMYYYGCR